MCHWCVLIPPLYGIIPPKSAKCLNGDNSVTSALVFGVNEQMVSVMPIGETPTLQKCFCFWWYLLPTLSQPACPDQVCQYGAKGTCTTSKWQRLVLSAAPGRAANARVTRNAMVGAAQIPGTSQYVMVSQWKFHWISFAFKTNCQDMEDEVHFNPVLLD